MGEGKVGAGGAKETERGAGSPWSHPDHQQPLVLKLSALTHEFTP